MKKVIQTRLVALSMMTLVPLLSPAVNTIIYNATYDFDNLTLGTDTLGGVTYTTVNYDGLFNGGEPGKPSLPIDYIKFSVPYNATNFTVTATSLHKQILNFSYWVYPFQTTQIICDSIPLVITLPDSSVYNSGNYYPLQKAWVVDEGFHAGENHIVTVAVMPVSYIKINSNNKLNFSSSLVINLQYDIENPDSLNWYPLVRRNMPMRNEGYRLTESLVVNPSDVIGNSLKNILIESLNTKYFDSIPLSSFILNSNGNNIQGNHHNDFPAFSYLIITPDSLKIATKRLAAFKRQKGYNVGIVTVEEIINNDSSSPWYHNVGTKIDYKDSVGIIKEYLKYAYCIGNIKYLLLAGQDVPFKIGWFNTTPTDQYYMDLSSNWETDYGHNESELFVGRIIAKTSNQINNYTDKLIRYELNPGNGDFSYLKRALDTNGYDQYIFTSNHDTITHADIIREYTDSIFPYVTLMEEDRDNHVPSGTDVIDELNDTQYGFISFNNHGLPLGIIMYGKGGPSPHVYYWLWAMENQHVPDSITSHANDDLSTGNGLDNMNNKYYPNICFSTSCSVMPFKTEPKYGLGAINFGESFTTGKGYGGPAFLGNTSENGFEAAILQKRVAHILRQQSSKLGLALALAKSHSYNTSYNEVQNLLGDPEFEVWTEEPQIYSNIYVERRNRSILVSGIDSDSTIVTIYSNDFHTITDTLSAQSKVFYGISPNSSIMIFKKNHIPYIAPLLLQNISPSNSQYVIAKDVTAGNHIDINRTYGDVTITGDIEYEIEASGVVRLDDGFIVEKGATFAVYPSGF